MINYFFGFSFLLSFSISYAENIKITHTEIVCVEGRKCDSPNDYKTTTENIQVPTENSKKFWTKTVNFNGFSFAYHIDFDEIRTGHFIYSSIYQYHTDQSNSVSASGGSLVQDYTNTFISQLQGPQQKIDNKHITSLVIVYDQNTDLNDLKFSKIIVNGQK